MPPHFAAVIPVRPNGTYLRRVLGTRLSLFDVGPNGINAINNGAKSAPIFRISTVCFPKGGGGEGGEGNVTKYPDDVFITVARAYVQRNICAVIKTRYNARLRTLSAAV